MAFTTQTKNQTITAFLRRYGSAGSTWAGELYDRAYIWALDKAEIRISSINVNLTADTREYDLSATLHWAESVEYWTSATEYTKLRSISRE
jgi:hypothetical protein